MNGVKKGNGQDYYSEDIWGVVAKEVESKIPNGFTLYGEIVGYTPDGSAIQKGYHYGSQIGSHQLVVYRVTLTTPDGLNIELTWSQMKEFCTKYGLQSVREIWFGKANDFPIDFPLVRINADDPIGAWQESLLRQLEGSYVNDSDCPYNTKGTPAEGIVVRVDRLNECESFKLKNFRFLESESKQLDTGEADLESIESEPMEIIESAA